MSRVLVDMSMSLDGFVAGPKVSVEEPMGERGLRLHRWIFDAESATDVARQREMYESTGAVVLGRRTYEVGLPHWEDTPYAAPCFVLTHRPFEPCVEKSGTFTAVADVAGANAMARAAAGDRDVRLMGGETANQFLAAGLVDEIRIQLAPVLLGGGSRLFEGLDGSSLEVESVDATESPHVLHLRYRVVREA